MAELKTNVMRILDKNRVDYVVHIYDPGNKIDGVSVAEQLGQPLNRVFKTLVTQGKTGNYYVFVIPVAEELNLKLAAKAAKEKSMEMIPVKDINKVTGYIRGGCSPIGMKKQYVTVMDHTAKGQETVLVSAGRIGFQIELSPKKLAELTKSEFTELTM